MPNPILQMLTRKNQPNPNETLQRLGSIKQFMSGKNSDLIYQQMMNSNPQFRDFVVNAKGKTLEDLAMEYDIDINLLRQFF